MANAAKQKSYWLEAIKRYEGVQTWDELYYAMLEDEVRGNNKSGEGLKPIDDKDYCQVHCPTCGWPNLHDSGDNRVNYCPYCGQKISWDGFD